MDKAWTLEDKITPEDTVLFPWEVEDLSVVRFETLFLLFVLLFIDLSICGEIVFKRL